MANGFRCFLKSNFVGVNSLLVIEMKMAIRKYFMLKNIMYQKELSMIITSMEKTFMINQLIMI